MVRTTDGVLPLMTGLSASDNSDLPTPSSQTVSHFFSPSDTINCTSQQPEQAAQHQPQPSQQYFSSHNETVPTSAVNSCVNVTYVASHDMLLRVITLNCWGLRFISQHRQQRIKSIAQHLKEQEYDIVFLQELWCQSDFEQIRSTTGYKFAHYFKTSSLVGTSGLAIFTRWSPETIHFEPYSVNGTPFMLNHGDYFAGKGVAYVRIDLNDLRLHLFCTHMHAQYDEDEQMTDMYSVHRICQAYQLSKFINLATENTNRLKSGSDLIVLAGDLNTTPGELPFKLLMSMTGLVDCAMHRYSHDVKVSLKSGLQDVTIDEDLITCGHHSNSFTVKSSRSTRTTSAIDRDQMSKSTGKRIDFILYKLNQSCNQCQGRDCSCYKFNSCLGMRVECLGKDPSTGLSFSDHQPVSVRLVIKRDSDVKKYTKSPGDSSLCINLKDKAMRAISSRFTYRDGKVSSEKVNLNDDNLLETRTNGQRSVSTDAGSPVATTNTNCNTKNRSKSTSDQSVQTTTCNSASNFLMDLLPGASKSVKHTLISEKSSLANNSNTSTTVISTSNVEFKRDSVSLEGLEEPSFQHLQSTYHLLSLYLNEKQSFKVKLFFIFLFLLGVSSCITFFTCGMKAISIGVAVNMEILAIVAASFVSFIVLIVDRLESTALKGILEELACILFFAPTASSIVN